MSTQPLLQRTAQKRIALPVRVEPKVSEETATECVVWFTDLNFNYLNVSSVFRYASSLYI